MPRSSTSTPGNPQLSPTAAICHMPCQLPTAAPPYSCASSQLPTAAHPSYIIRAPRVDQLLGGVAARLREPLSAALAERIRAAVRQLLSVSGLCCVCCVADPLHDCGPEQQATARPGPKHSPEIAPTGSPARAANLPCLQVGRQPPGAPAGKPPPRRDARIQKQHTRGSSQPSLPGPHDPGKAQRRAEGPKRKTPATPGKVV
jgi:hypothetical protein